MIFEELARDGWSIDCPFCGRAILYSLINNRDLPVPFFYGERTNDVLLRKQDQERVDQLFQSIASGRSPSTEEFEALWKSILENAPDAPAGGRFGFWSNIKCPHCRKEIPYNKGVKNVELRIFEPRIVLVDGAVLLGDSPDQSWRVRVLPARDG